MDLLVNPKEEDLKFLDKVDQFFEAVGRLAYELPLYKIYKNNLYHFFMDAVHVSTTLLCQYNARAHKRERPCNLRICYSTGRIQNLYYKYLKSLTAACAWNVIPRDHSSIYSSGFGFCPYCSRRKLHALSLLCALV